MHPRVAQHDHVQQVAKPGVGKSLRFFGEQPSQRQAARRPGQPSAGPDRLRSNPCESGDELISRLAAEFADLLLVVGLQR
jgi:hypothetical protein